VEKLFTSTILMKKLQELLRFGKETRVNFQGFLTQSKYLMQTQIFFNRTQSWLSAMGSVML